MRFSTTLGLVLASYPICIGCITGLDGVSRIN
jgi:hypothetical protein